MFTGIVQALVPIETCENKPGLKTFGLRLPAALQGELDLGASIAINGCCLTVTSMSGDYVQFDAIDETLSLSNIKYVEQGSQVNVERSIRANAEIGGHILSGHIIDTAFVSHIVQSENNLAMTFKGKPAWLKYVFNKGFLAVNGCSLTIARLDAGNNTFLIHLIPETLQRTNFSRLKVGDEVNIEIEQQTQTIVDTVERVMAERYKI